MFGKGLSFRLNNLYVHVLINVFTVYSMYEQFALFNV